MAGGVAEAVPEGSLPGFGPIRAIQLAGKPAEALFQFFGPHPERVEHDVEEGAAVPVALGMEPAFPPQPRGQRRALERREERDLALRQAAFKDEVPGRLEDAGAIGVEADAEAAVGGSEVIATKLELRRSRFKETAPSQGDNDLTL